MHRGSREDPFRQLARVVGEHSPWLMPEQTLAESKELGRASVALVLRSSGDALELLLIKRATRTGDPWSGHIALPGGRSGPADADARATAERETWEEVGIDLRAHGTLLGRLDDVQPRSGAPSILVSAFVFSVLPGTEPVWNDEVDIAVWASLDQLAAPNAATEYLHSLSTGENLRLPALTFQGHLIWGITFRIVTQFLGLLRPARFTPAGDATSPHR